MSYGSGDLGIYGSDTLMTPIVRLQPKAYGLVARQSRLSAYPGGITAYPDGGLGVSMMRPRTGAVRGTAVVGPGKAVLPHQVSRTGVTDQVSYRSKIGKRQRQLARSAGGGRRVWNTSLAGDDSGLGIAPAIVIGGGKILGGLVNPHPQDGQRLAQNGAWYLAAQAGDRGAWLNLGIAGRVIAPQPGAQMTGGWASAAPTTDAAAKYRELAPKFSGVNQATTGGAVDYSGKFANTTGGMVANPAVTPNVANASLAPSPDWLQQFFQAFASTPGGQQIVGDVTQQVAKPAAASAIGNFVVEHPAALAVGILGTLFLVAKVAK